MRPGAGRLVGVALALALALAACGGNADGEAVKLDGSPRVPDDEGIVTAVNGLRLTLDDRRTYSISPRLRSFAAVSLALIPVRQTKGQYVQVGLRDTTVVWLGRIADVVQTDHLAAFYVGHVVEVDDRRLIMRDGTVLTLAEGVQPPPAGRDVTAEIDPGRHVVVRLTLR